ncbi:uncharacterized protein LOC133886306 [Phragmites australis]|uniref:uncharacterized protein LOC133886306 n=1 Tax=Phragmites australis TaxID=29695 RepID=UPI002D798A64|nr:uncharacterized protein LOC133886306 [Phragmites australis]
MTGCETCPGTQLGVGSRQPALQQPPATQPAGGRHSADGQTAEAQTGDASRGSPGRSSGCRYSVAASPVGIRRFGWLAGGSGSSTHGCSGRHPSVCASAARRGAAAAGAQLGVSRRQVPRSAVAGGAVAAQRGHEVGRASGVGEATSYGSARGELPFGGSDVTELGTGALRQPAGPQGVGEAAGGQAVGGSAAGGPAQGFSDSQMGSGRLGAP